MEGKFYFNLKRSGFTVIELLVVIAVIGLLASIILVNIDLPKQKQKAKIAKTLEFSQSIQNALGSEAVGIWSFDNNVLDSSGYGNNGTINGGATFTDDTPQKIIGQVQGKYALSFDGVDDYISVPDSPSLSPTSVITIEAWVNLNAAGGNWAPISFKEGPEGRAWWFGFYPGSTSRIHWSNAGLTTWSLDGDIPSALGVWRHIVVTYQNGVGRRLYVDGVLQTFDTASGNIPDTSGTLFIGGGGWQPINGLIDEVRIYSQALTIGQIQKHYAEGLEKHQNLATK